MFTQKEKDRRAEAARKRLDEAEKRVETHRERPKKAEADVKKEEKGLAWLREAPITDEDEPEEVQEYETEAEQSPPTV